MTREFTITPKLRWQDTVSINGITKKVGWFMTMDPLALWKAVHTRGNKLSLTSDVYGILKEKIEKDHPEEVERTERKKRLVASKRKFKNHEGRFLFLRRHEPRIKSD